MKDEPLPDAELRRAKDHLKGSLMLEPREHVEPHVAPGAAGDLLRPAVRSRRDAGRHRARDRRGRAARRARSLRATALGGDGARATSTAWSVIRERAGARSSADGPRIDDSALHAPRDGSHLERPAPIRDLARRWKLAAADAMADAGIVPAEAARDLREQGALRHRAHRRDRTDDAARRDRLHDRGRRTASGRPRAGCTSA